MTRQVCDVVNSGKSCKKKGACLRCCGVSPRIRQLRVCQSGRRLRTRQRLAVARLSNRASVEGFAVV